jgi:hypothetical protein
MIRNKASLCCLALATLLSGCSAGSAAPSPTPSPQAAPIEEAEDPTTADGIFTLAQAQRGEDLYGEVCSECHDTSDWTDSGFKSRWEDQSVFQLWYYINDRMPYEDPYSLSRQQVTDALTYILRLNGLPAGDEELATDDDSIDDYWIQWRP